MPVSKKKFQKRFHSKRSPLRKVMGLHSCMETLKVRPKKIRSIYLQKNWSRNKDLKWIVEQSRRFRIDLIEQTRDQLFSWGENHQGVALIVEESPTAQVSGLHSVTFVFIDGLEDPRNLGSIIRTSWLMGVHGIFLPDTRNSMHHLSASVCKSASGGAEHVPVQFLQHPYQWMQSMKKDGYWIYGLDVHGTDLLWEEVFHKKTILVAGSESRGLKTKTKKMCDKALYIPQQSETGSYNLSISLALGISQVSKTT